MKTMMLSVSAAVALGKIAAAYAIDVSDWDALKTGVATDGVAEITVGTDIAASSNLDTSKTSGSGTPVSRDLIVSGASSSSAPTVSGGGNNMYLRVGDGATLTLKDIAFSDFRHYQATDRNSVLASHQGGNLVLDNARLSGISNDDAQPMWGAVVSLSDKSQASIVNSVFENNNQKTSNEGVDAATGGVIHLQGQTSRHDLSKSNVLSGSTFSGNSLTATKTSAFGGAAYLEGWVGTMENNSFVGNAAKTESNAKDAFGGAISVGGANVGRGAATIESIVGGSFKNNTAASEKGKSYGGAIYVSADGVINGISGVEFSGNAADFGGAIYNAGNIVRMADSTFDATDDVENASGGTIGTISGIQMKGTLTNGGTIDVIDGINGIAGLVNGGVIGQIDGTNVVGNLQNTGTGSITVNSGDFSVTGTFFNDANASIANNGAIGVSGDAVNNGSITGNSIKFGGGSLTNNGSLVGVAAGSVIANLTNTKEIGVISDTEISGAFVNAESATVENRFGGASAVVENSGVLNFNAADFTGTLNNYRRFNLTGENTLTGAFVNSGETTVAAGARASFSGGIENSRNIVNNGVLIVEGGNSFNGGTITGGIRFDGDASLENDGTIDGIEDSRFANSRGAALLNNGKIDRLSNVTVDGLFENASGAVFVENNLTATRTINDASLDFSGVAYTGTLLNRSRLSTTGDNTVAGGALKNAGLLSVGAGSLTLAGGLENTSVILNSGVLTAAGTSVNSGFISGDIVVGDGSVSDFVNNGYIMGKTTISANAEMTNSLDTLNDVDIAAGGMADVEDKTVTVGALRLNGTLNIGVASIAAGSSVYAGGGQSRRQRRRGNRDGFRFEDIDRRRHAEKRRKNGRTENRRREQCFRRVRQYSVEQPLYDRCGRRGRDDRCRRLGVDFAVGGWDFSAGYDFSVREDYRSHAGKLKARCDF